MAEERVWIAQCLCPQRHCILAGVGLASSETAAEATVAAPLHDQIADLVKWQVLNPWCGLCGAHRGLWTIQLGRTAWTSMEAAMPSLRTIEQLNALAQSLFGDIHRGKPN